MRRSNLALSAAALLLALAGTVRADLVGVDIGGPDPAGSFWHDQFNDVYYVTGSGADIWNDSDQFYFVYEEVIGSDIVLTARVDSILGNTVQGWQKGAVMIRRASCHGRLMISGTWVSSS